MYEFVLAVMERNINTDSLQVLALIEKIRSELALKVEAITKLRGKRAIFQVTMANCLRSQAFQAGVLIPQICYR